MKRMDAKRATIPMNETLDSGGVAGGIGDSERQVTPIQLSRQGESSSSPPTLGDGQATDAPTAEETSTKSTSTQTESTFSNPACKPSLLNYRFRLSSLFALGIMLLLCVPIATLIDVPVARWFAKDPLPREVYNAVELMRVFSHGSGIFLVLFGIFLMAPRCRWQLPRLVTLAVGAGAFATLGRIFVLRPRPTGFNLDVASMDSAWLWAFDWTLSQVATFDASTRAFPSGNMATATALTIGLWMVLPSGRILFGLMCFGTVLQRLACGAHFPSDLFGGGAFGVFWAFICYHPKLLGNLFDKMQPESEPRRLRDSADRSLSVHRDDDEQSPLAA